MSVSFSLSDSSFPASGAFIDFLLCFVEGRQFSDVGWEDQVTEGFSGGDRSIDKCASRNARALLALPRGRELIAYFYKVVHALLSSDFSFLRREFAGYKFSYVVGVPRSGGTFLLRRLLLHHNSCAAYPVSLLPALAIHDGTPDVSLPGALPVLSSLNRNVVQLAELFVALKLLYPRKCTVVKKMSRYAFAGPLLSSVFPSPRLLYVTIRHPCNVALSTLDKCGAGARFRSGSSQFAVRCAIDEQVLQSVCSFYGFSSPGVFSMSYVKCFALYWRLFYLSLLGSFGTEHVILLRYGDEISSLPALEGWSSPVGSELNDFVTRQYSLDGVSHDDLIFCQSVIRECWRRV